MIGFVIATHGALGSGLKSAVELIAGDDYKIKAVELVHGEGPEEYEKRFREALVEMDEGDGVFVFVDFYGGTPCNTAMRCLRNSDIPCIIGVNLPMLLEAVTQSECSNIKELEGNILEIGKAGITTLSEQIKILSNNMENDF